MIISEIVLSYPCVKYRVEVTHFTARKSTAIEWLILESIEKCDAMPKYAGISIDAFFSQIFAITDTDRLIKPCLLSLQDLGAISAYEISDETELSTVRMSSLQLTESGREMQRQGLLPGSMAEDAFIIYYDAISDELIEGTNQYKENAAGLQVIELADESTIDFPGAKIRNWLEACRKEKGRGRMNWLTPTTRIEDVSPLASELFWKNTTKKVEITDGLNWNVIGNDDARINELALMKSDIGCPAEYADMPYAEISNLDDEAEKVISVPEVRALIKENIARDNMFCVSAKYYIETSDAKKKKNQTDQKKGRRIGVVFGAAGFEVKIAGRQMLLRIPENLPGQDWVYLNSVFSIHIGKFLVRSGETAKDIALAYIPKKGVARITDVMAKLVDKYYIENKSVLFVLTELGLNGLFLEYVGRIVSGLEIVREKADAIQKINSDGMKYYQQKPISASDMERLLIDEKHIVGKSASVNGAVEVIREYAAVNSFRQNDLLFQKVLGISLRVVPEQDDLEDIWALWEEIGKVKKTHINWINKEGLYRKLYSPKGISLLFKKFNSEDAFNIQEYTPVEQVFLGMNQIYFRIQEMLGDVDILEANSKEKMAEVVLSNRDNLKALYEEIRKWRDGREKFASEVMDMEDVASEDIEFMRICDSIDKISDAIAIFFDDSFMKYNKVYIVDTCTLLNEPGLISWFDDDKALLVIPLIVLDELDGIKNDEDEERAYKAREAIRLINNYRSYEWLNTGEVSHTELLSKDLDPDRNDNKILSIALKYSVKMPVLLTDDINFGNIAEAQNIRTITLDSYRSMKEDEKRRVNNGAKKSNGQNYNKQNNRKQNIKKQKKR